MMNIPTYYIFSFYRVCNMEKKEEFQIIYKISTGYNISFNFTNPLSTYVFLSVYLFQKKMHECYLQL